MNGELVVHCGFCLGAHMDYANQWIVEVWRLDRRVKAGRRLVERHSYSDQTQEQVEQVVADLCRLNPRYDLVLRPAYRRVKNIMTGDLVWESVDTPWSCSVASEAYWSA
jgi:hypothetical protein